MTCSISIESTETTTISSGTVTSTFWFGCRCENFATDESISSSSIVGVLLIFIVSFSIRVTDRRFSTMRMSHSESF